MLKKGRHMKLKLLFNFAIAISSLLCSQIANAKEYTIGLSVWTGYPDSITGFKEALAKEGFLDGKNVRYLLKNAHADSAKQTEIANSFAEQKVDMVYSLTTPGTIIIKDILPDTTPIVFSIVTYPVDLGLIESYDYSGNNLVGTSNFVPLKNYISLLKSVLPAAKSVAIFHRKGEPNSIIQAVNLRRMFKKSGVSVIDITATDIPDLARKAQAIAADVDVFITTTDTLMQSGGERKLIEISLATSTPILSSNKKGIAEGSTFGQVADFYLLGQMSGKVAAKILKGEATPSSLKSRLQEPPIILLNRSSMDSMKLKVGGIKNFKYVE